MAISSHRSKSRSRAARKNGKTNTRAGALAVSDSAVSDAQVTRLPARVSGNVFVDEPLYAPAPESADHVRLETRYPLFINGEFRAPQDGGWMQTINPATEEPIAEVATAGAQDLESAVVAARAAQASGRSCRRWNAGNICSAWPA